MARLSPFTLSPGSVTPIVRARDIASGTTLNSLHVSYQPELLRAAGGKVLEPLETFKVLVTLTRFRQLLASHGNSSCRSIVFVLLPSFLL